MHRRIPFLLLALSLGASAPLRAQIPDWVTQILTAAQLPVTTAEARREGAPNDEIRAVLDAMNKANIPASEAKVVIDTARVARREHGPVDNFGAFVQSQLAAGKRGRELAAAIRAEHARVGKGKGHAEHDDKAKSDDDDDDDKKGKKSDDDEAKRRGRDSQPAGPPGAARKPDDRGKGRKPVKP